MRTWLYSALALVLVLSILGGVPHVVREAAGALGLFVLGVLVTDDEQIGASS